MGRRNGILLEDRLCAFCENNGIVVNQDEYHFLLHCPRYQEEISKKHLVLYNVISYSNFLKIMTAKNVDLIQDLYTYCCMKCFCFLMKLPSYEMCYTQIYHVFDMLCKKLSFLLDYILCDYHV